MAVLWRLESGGTRYEVRGHGTTRRLFSDGVFHSAWHPPSGLTGRAWDLFLPAAFTLPALPRRVLVLGIGAGTVLLQYRRFLDPEKLVGVDLDPVHVEVGHRWFGLGAARAALHLADAREWVDRWDGAPFDLVVDDLYGHGDGQPRRAVPMTPAWAAALERLVAPGGALVVNFISAGELKACAQLRAARARAGYACGFRFAGLRDENAIAAFCRSPTTPAAIRGRLRRILELDDRRRGCRLRYRLRRLW